MAQGPVRGPWAVCRGITFGVRGSRPWALRVGALDRDRAKRMAFMAYRHGLRANTLLVYIPDKFISFA